MVRAAVAVSGKAQRPLTPHCSKFGGGIWCCVDAVVRLGNPRHTARQPNSSTRFLHTCRAVRLARSVVAAAQQRKGLAASCTMGHRLTCSCRRVVLLVVCCVATLLTGAPWAAHSAAVQGCASSQARRMRVAMTKQIKQTHANSPLPLRCRQRGRECEYRTYRECGSAAALGRAAALHRAELPAI